MKAFSFALLLVLVCRAGVAQVISGPLPDAPEPASGYSAKSPAVARKFMVSAAHPLATEAGVGVLRAGGSALDAAIAVQMVLTLVEPQASGIGGGAFLLHYDGRALQAFDGRETAPAAAAGDLFKRDGKTLGYLDSVVGGRAVGVPGVLRMLELAHREHGKLKWARLFEPAIKLAERGFPISPRLALLLRKEAHLKKDPAAAAYFFDRNGEPHPAGHVLKNPELAAVLRRIAGGGADAFYEGRIARDIVAKVASHPDNPGELTQEDIAAYRAKVREAVCSDYRKWTVCGMPPPSSGGIAVAQMLGILETRDLQSLAPRGGIPRAEAIHLISEAGRLAYADRNRFVADPDFVPLPGASPAALLARPYLAERAALIGPMSMGTARSGAPVTAKLALGTDASPELPATSHVSIVDARGNALAMTTSIESVFGSRQMVHGFLLNNQLTDFSFEAADAEGPIANRVAGGKRPRSSMAPTLVFEKGGREVVLALGSPGGSTIINYVAKTLIGMMDWGLTLQQAIELPNFGSRNGPTELERERFPPAVIEQLKQQGHAVRELDQTSGLQGVMRFSAHGEAMWMGGADPRRDGSAAGH